ncbi:MAG: cyclase family protein [Desulfarculus sp.]|nr:cyclase family protein [Desulfarculus sp.]
MPGPLWDVSLSLGREGAAYPGDPPYWRHAQRSLERGDPFTLSSLGLCAHSGTHLDAPAHFLPHGRTLDAYPPQRFVLPAWLVEAPGGPTLGPEVLDGVPPQAQGRALLFKTANSARGLATATAWSPDYVHLGPELARRCLDWGAELVGLDAPSLDSPGSDDYPVHRLLLEADALILEGLNLAEPPPGPYLLICAPLKLDAAEAAPARALLWSEDDWSPPGLDLGQTRLQAARAMAGAACHAMNQPLQALLSQCEMLADELEGLAGLEAPRRRLQTMLDQLRRLAVITDRLHRLVRYATIQYPGRQRIVDLERATLPPEGEGPV